MGEEDNARRLDAVEGRVELLEKFEQESREGMAAAAEREKSLLKWMARIDKRFEKSDENAAWVIRALVAIAIGWAANFVYSGGLNIQ